MTFAHVWVLHFLWLIPAVGLALVWRSRRREMALARFAEPGLLGRLTGAPRPGVRFLKGALLLAALGLMIFSLAGPRWGSRYQEVTQKGVDIVVLADVSPSMLVEDVKPNRLERARREIHDFLQVVQGDRVGLVAFAGSAYVQCPLTLDYAALEMFLQTLGPEIIPVSGTDLGAAIETGLSAFDPKAETDKVMLLITDGEDNEGRGKEAARKAAGKGVKIFVFGIGETAGGPIPAVGQGGFKKDDAGKMILSRMDEGSLREIAEGTGGRYVRSVAGDLDLDLLYFNGIRSATTAKTLKSGKIRIEEERFFLFLLPALLFLLIEGFLAERKSLPTNLLFAPLLLGSLILPGQARAAEDPDRLFRTGRYAEAEKAYADLDLDHPKDVRYRYNRGCAAFQGGNHQAAVAAFSSALARAGDDALRFKAAYNLGNVMFQQGDFAAAADLYRRALGYNPGSLDARHNLELALRKREQQKQDEQQKKDQGDKNGQKGSPGKGEKGQDGGEQGDGGKEQASGGQDGAGKDRKSGDKAGPESSAGDRGGLGEKERGQGREPGSAASEKTPDLSGELRPLQELPERARNDAPAGPAASAADRNMAEALLNSVSEDRSHLRAGKRRSVRSGKDW